MSNRFFIDDATVVIQTQQKVSFPSATNITSNILELNRQLWGWQLPGVEL